MWSVFRMKVHYFYFELNYGRTNIYWNSSYDAENLYVLIVKLIIVIISRAT